MLSANYSCIKSTLLQIALQTALLRRFARNSHWNVRTDVKLRFVYGSNTTKWYRWLVSFLRPCEQSKIWLSEKTSDCENMSERKWGREGKAGGNGGRQRQIDFRYSYKFDPNNYRGMCVNRCPEDVFCSVRRAQFTPYDQNLNQNKNVNNQW